MRSDVKDGKRRASLEVEKPRRSSRRLSKYGSYIKDRPWLSYGDDEPEIQFSFGRPDMEQFPLKTWIQIAGQVSKKPEFSLLDCPSKSAGYLPLRQTIAAHIAKSRAVNCSPEQIIIINGSQQGIDLVSRILIDRGDQVGIEDPGYIGARKAFEVAGAQLVGIPVDGSGVVVEKLKDTALLSMKLLYCTPSHQFPTGVVLPLPRRLELLNWAQLTGTYLIEDDYDSEYRYAGRPVPSLAGLDHSESVIYIGTFSKVLFPALRLGYLVVPPGLSEVFRRAKFLADRHSPLVQQQILNEFIKQGHYERHIRRMRVLYEQRRKILAAALRKEFQSVDVMGENAGINLLIRIHERMDDDAFIKNARELGVGLVRTNQFYISKPPAHEFLLNFAALSNEQIEEGVSRLAKAAALARRPDLLVSE